MNFLKNYYKKNKYPNKEEMEKLAKQLNMTNEKLLVWFKNQRQNSKNRNKKK